MAVKVNQDALERAKKLIKDGSVATDSRDEWSEHAPSTDAENSFIDEKGMDEFGNWHLGVESDADKSNKGAYSFPYGDFETVHRGAVIAAKVRAGQYDHGDIEAAADELLQLIDAK